MQSNGHRTILIILLIWAALSLPLSAAAENAQSLVYDEHGKRDPFMRLVDQNGNIISPEKDLKTSDMILGGIIADKTGNNVAIINGNVVKVNDTIGPFIIISIQPDEVIMIKGEERVVLKLKKEE